MTRRPRNLIAFVLALFFTSAILCSTFASSGLALASVIGCSQMPGDMTMAGCENPNYLCGIDPANNLLSHGGFASARLNDSLKNALRLTLGAPVVDVFRGLAPPGARAWRNFSRADPGKVSVRLVNSVLNL